MVFAEGSIAGQQVPDGVILPAKLVGGRHSGQAAELGLGENLYPAASFGALSIDLLGPFELVALVPFGPLTKSLIADDQHRRLGVDVVGRGPAEAGHVRAGVSPSERAELAGKNDELSRERLSVLRTIRRG
jgi:hypothetical protein